MKAKAGIRTPSTGHSAPGVLPQHPAPVAPVRGAAPVPYRSLSGSPCTEKDALERGVRRLVSSVFWGSAKRGRKMGASEVARLGSAQGSAQDTVPSLRDPRDPLQRSLSDLAGRREHARCWCTSTSASASTSTSTSSSGATASDRNSGNDGSSSHGSSPRSIRAGGRWACPLRSCNSLPAGTRLGRARSHEGKQEARDGSGREPPVHSDHSESVTWAWIHTSSEATLSKGRKWAHAAARAGQGSWDEACSNLLSLRAPGAVLLQVLLALLLLLTPTGVLAGVPQSFKALLGLSLLSLLLLPSTLSSFPGLHHHKPEVGPTTSQGAFSAANAFRLPEIILSTHSQATQETPKGPLPVTATGSQESEAGGGGRQRPSSSSSPHHGASHGAATGPRVHHGAAKAGLGRRLGLAGGFSWKALCAVLLRTHAHPAALAQAVL